MTSELSCFLLFFTFSLSLRPLALCHSLSLPEVKCTVLYVDASDVLSACALIDLGGWRGCDGRSDFVQYLPSVGLSYLGGKRMKFDREEEEGKMCSTVYNFN